MLLFVNPGACLSMPTLGGAVLSKALRWPSTLSHKLQRDVAGPICGLVMSWHQCTNGHSKVLNACLPSLLFTQAQTLTEDQPRVFKYTTDTIAGLYQGIMPSDRGSENLKIISWLSSKMWLLSHGIVGSIKWHNTIYRYSRIKIWEKMKVKIHWAVDEVLDDQVLSSRSPGGSIEALRRRIEIPLLNLCHKHWQQYAVRHCSYHFLHIDSSLARVSAYVTLLFHWWRGKAMQRSTHTLSLITRVFTRYKKAWTMLFRILYPDAISLSLPVKGAAPLPQCWSISTGEEDEEEEQKEKHVANEWFLLNHSHRKSELLTLCWCRRPANNTRVVSQKPLWADAGDTMMDTGSGQLMWMCQLTCLLPWGILVKVSHCGCLLSKPFAPYMLGGFDDFHCSLLSTLRLMNNGGWCRVSFQQRKSLYKRLPLHERPAAAGECCLDSRYSLKASIWCPHQEHCKEDVTYYYGIQTALSEVKLRLSQFSHLWHYNSKLQWPMNDEVAIIFLHEVVTMTRLTFHLMISVTSLPAWKLLKGNMQIRDTHC